MCGIVGVVGKPAREVVLNGLKNLEYRGYDSAGIYLNDLQGHEYLTKALAGLPTWKKSWRQKKKGRPGSATPAGQPTATQRWKTPTHNTQKTAASTWSTTG